MTSSDHSHKCATCPTRHKTEWRDLTEQELELIELTKKSRIYEPGETLYHQGDNADGVFCIQSGLVGARFIDVDGNSALLRLNGEGKTVGYRAFLSRQPQGSSAEVLTPSFICHIDGDALSKLLANSPQVGERFLQHAIEDMNDTESQFGVSLTGSVKVKFLHTLMVFYRQHGSRCEDGLETIDLPIKRSDIAEMIGARPESISRLVRSLQDEELLKFDGRKVSFTNMEAVMQEAGLTA